MPTADGPLGSVLIANRGEIACRIIRTARHLGLRTIAVYSDADAASLHVEMADTAVHIGPSPATDSYLNIAAILEAARQACADAVHPGYGFLSENAEFAERCAAAGLVFVGPSPRAIRVMGDKSQAKALMEKANVPLVPGYHGSNQEAGHLAKEAAAIGFPLLIKAAAGGGGRGMRIVRHAEAFEPALASARREAKAAFGDDHVLLESFIESSRHIEVQIFADRHGNVVHLFDRDCSIQRRHQKILEEAPAPNLAAQTRTAMQTAALVAARAVAYEGAGTVEFIVAPDGRFYFLEMNTRLQVEHPVTEQITGHDLVAWQFAVAAGEPLPVTQSEIHCQGHAIEVRLYAEDPAREFLPAAGRLDYLRLPDGDPAIRVDAGVRTGDEIAIYYDPMLAKIVAHARDRSQAVVGIQHALGQVRIAGIANNLDFLEHLVAHPDFAAAQVDTGFIESAGPALIQPPVLADPDILSLVTLFLLDRRQRGAVPRAVPSQDRHSPWAQANGWRLNFPATQEVRFTEGSQEHCVVATASAADRRWHLDISGELRDCRLISMDGAELIVEIGQTAHQVTIVATAQAIFLFRGGCQYRFAQIDRLTAADRAEQAAGALVSPMPGRVTQVHVGVGASVSRGQVLLVIEAMKMEHMIVSPADGVVTALHFGAGDQVAEATELLRVEPHDSGTIA